MKLKPYKLLFNLFFKSHPIMVSFVSGFKFESEIQKHDAVEYVHKLENLSEWDSSTQSVKKIDENKYEVFVIFGKNSLLFSNKPARFVYDVHVTANGVDFESKSNGMYTRESLTVKTAKNGKLQIEYKGKMYSKFRVYNK